MTAWQVGAGRKTKWQVVPVTSSRGESKNLGRKESEDN